MFCEVTIYFYRKEKVLPRNTLFEDSIALKGTSQIKP